ALLLLANSRGPRSVLFLRERDELRERWEGERIGLKRARRRFDVDEVRSIEDIVRDLPELLRDNQTLHFPPGINPTLDRLVWDLFCSPVSPRPTAPTQLRDARLLLSEMRWVKDREEIAAIRHAADITAHGLAATVQALSTAKSELHCARLLEGHFARLGATGVGFETIVASGRHRTVLHHHSSLQPLWKRKPVLIDCGARFQGYCGDITRTFPPHGGFPGAERDVYLVVYRALQRALSKAKPRSTLDRIHNAAVRELTKGLVELGILEADARNLVSEGAYRPYYMHKTSHWLGLDVHDISPLHANPSRLPLSSSSRELVPGVVFTIEPGLYFDERDTSVPEAFRGIGVRLEEDVVITATGHTVLSSTIPVAIDDVENLVG
ncbi:MAG: aminopeptidase P N-terminal domain-containing protein, partial [Bdellovibrionales bacterium]|nr:aminopeptidase P N-terminal domain-containing protein [Bdellovibrionales bacterium]